VRYAVLSDVHGRPQKLEAVLADARARGVDCVVSLGDVGSDDCVALLLKARALAVFGNYEVSGWRRLAAHHQAWVRRWPPLLVSDRFLAVHAAPWWPEGLQSLDDFAAWLKKTGQSWRALFPYMGEDESSLWRALHQLEIAGRTILFHGHTHQQTAWRWEASGRMCQERARAIPVAPTGRYVVGVGSVGMPENGGWAEYAYYDSSGGHIELVRLAGRQSARWPTRG
jgi:predicted phosphodiesterase